MSHPTLPAFVHRQLQGKTHRLLHAFHAAHATRHTVSAFIDAAEREGSELPITLAASANQAATNTILRENPKEWPRCLSYKLNHSNRVKDRLIPNKPFKIGHSARSQMTKHIRYRQMMQVIFICMSD